MPRILVCECKQEVSSFNPVLSRYTDFATFFGEDVIRYHRPIQSEMGGALSVFAERPDIEVAPGYATHGITSAGTLADADFHRLTGEFLDAVRNARDIDAIYFSLHGSLAAENEPDVEGYLLAETRKIVGERMPLVASFDLHGVLTDRMIEHCDAATVYHTYPHVDFFQTGVRAARLLLQVMAGEVRPVTARVAIPALVRGYELITETGMFGQCVRRAIAVENSAGGLSGGMFIGNPFTDVPDLCSNAFIVTDGDGPRAEREALSIAQEFWEMRAHLRQPLTSLAESVRLAAACTGRAVMVDAADATSSGASGDSNAVLRALREAGYQRTVLIPIVDGPAVAAAFQAGVGKTIRTRVGGTLDRARFTPLEIEGRVRMLSDGKHRSESHGALWEAGDTAVLESDNVTLVVTSRPVSLYDRSLFLAHGLDPAAFDSVVVKSPHCQSRFFADGAERMINIDAPGSSSANLPYLGHKRCARPIFPLDEGVTFTPQAKLFERKR